MLAMALSVVSLYSQTDDRLSIVEREDGRRDLFFDNRENVPVYVCIDLTGSRNIITDVPLPACARIEPRQRQQALSTAVVDTGQSSALRVRFGTLYGDPAEVNPDFDHLYHMPFQHGTKQRVDQGYNGSFTHRGVYALDFPLEIGDPIYAAREGMVVAIKEDSRSGGASARYNDDANFALIKHSDNTFALYAHLDFNGVLVEPGELVSLGAIIGYSGNTGYSSGPHLHFEVQTPRFDGTMKSIKTRFRDHLGNPINPVEGDYIYASFPGGAPFEAVFGSSLTGEDFENYRADVKQNGMLSFRSDRVDDRMITYFANGYDYDISIAPSYSLRGVTRDNDNLPETLEIPALTEVFAGLYSIAPGARSIAISPQYQISRVGAIDDAALNSLAQFSGVARDAGQVGFRIEDIGGAYASFVSNGFPYNIQVKVSYTVIGARPDENVPDLLDVPARTEIFSGLFYPTPGSNGVRISPRYSITRQ